ncbi:hypothetical protein [Sutcliffiella horikoshii]|uniref:hypothetical protein n=1 Tax=Sutcliffiella horikoshii TaxID=79883 RepID=UPI001F2571EC|nr:hypothetical protein [Sutcliffiella horikoshii]MCG1020151.1 hypothetical protein [Sutcliffiella horikoshii]
MTGNLFRIQQQVIHYRSEAEKYKNKIEQMEMLLEKEKIRNSYLQSKVIDMKKEMQNSHVNQLKNLNNKILELEVQLEEEKAINQVVQATDTTPTGDPPSPQTPSLYSFFNYSILLPLEGESETTIISDLNIVNTGGIDIEDLILCLKVKPINKVSLSAKIANPKLYQDNEHQKLAADWIYAIEDWRNKILSDGEYWVRPIHHSTLLKNSTMRLKGMELMVDKKIFKGRLTVEAFVYGSNIKEGTPSLNKIIVQI